MALLISNAILHTIGNNNTLTHYSDVGLEVDSETCTEFVGKHVRRLLRNPSAKQATFAADSPVYALVKSFHKDEIHFKDLSRRLCERLAEIMEGNDDISPADVLVALFDNGKDSYLAIVKLNYGECFTHRLITDDDGQTENRVVKNTMVLPQGGGKVEEACLIPYDAMVLRILEKPHTVGGEEICYFSKQFLECETELSQKETAEVIQEIADEINVKYFDGNVEMAARLKTALIVEAEELREEDGLILENVVELRFPSELVDDPTQLQMVINQDGSTTITLKNLRPAEL